MRLRFFTYILLCVLPLYTTSLLHAQVVAGKSRLDVGQTPKKSAVGVLAPVKSYVGANKVPTEVRLNNSSAVNGFYRQLLLTNSSKSVTAKTDSRVVSANEQSDDFLYNTDKIRVSNIYPNPANDYTKLDYKLAGGSTKATIMFYNLLGTKMGTVDLSSFEDEVEVSTRSWDSGVYLYQLVVDGKKVATKKLLVRHN